MKQVYCACQRGKVEWDQCDGCDDYDDLYPIEYEEPPFYPSGHLAGMTLDQLEREVERQCDIQGSLGDAEYIDEAAVERAESRYRLVKNEIARRSANGEPTS